LRQSIVSLKPSLWVSCPKATQVLFPSGKIFDFIIKKVLIYNTFKSFVINQSHDLQEHINAFVKNCCLSIRCDFLGTKNQIVSNPKSAETLY
jgi:hypothetical protein